MHVSLFIRNLYHIALCKPVQVLEISAVPAPPVSGKHTVSFAADCCRIRNMPDSIGKLLTVCTFHDGIFQL